MKPALVKIVAAGIILMSTMLVEAADVQHEAAANAAPRGVDQAPANHRIAAKDALVKIYSVANQPDYYRPWSMIPPLNFSGSGAVIANNRILTNAHVVADHSYIEVRRHGQWRKYPAEVVAVSHEADLALLSVAEPGFFDGIAPLEFGDLPEPHEEVMVLGFPEGGDSLSITKGVISRIEHSSYTHSSRWFLAGQIDAAINPGNSGGPVIVGGKVVGVVMQSIPGLENTGYMVPVPIIQHFLKDIADGRRDGIPHLGLVTVGLENPGMKRHHRMTVERSGVLVTNLQLGSPAAGLLVVDDVLLAVDGHRIADDASIEFRPEERTFFNDVIQRKQVGESVTFDVLRGGKELKVTVPLTRNADGFGLVADERYEQSPRYLIFGGIVFTPLTKNLLFRWGEKWYQTAPPSFLVEMGRFANQEYREPVVVLYVFPDEINRGYHQLENWLVNEVNGHRIRDFDDFCQAIAKADSEFVIMKDRNNYQVVIDRKQEPEANARILERYQIPAEKSAEAREKR